MNTDAGTSSSNGSSETTDFSLKSRLYVMMFLQYFVQGAYLPIISVYLQDALGFNADELGMFFSALAVGPLLAPFVIGQLVDRHVATERLLAFCHLASGALMIGLYFQTDFWNVVILGTIYSTLYVPTMMLTNSLTFHHLKNRDREFPAVRLWGTVGFVVPAWVIELYFLSGLEGDTLNTARGVALALSGGASIVMGLYSLTLPHTPPQRRDESEFAPGKVVGLLRHRNFAALVLISFLIAIVHKFYFVWNSPFLKVILQAGGIKGAMEQRISSIGQISEVAVMAGLGLSILKFGFKRTMMAGAIAYLVRCLLFALAITLDGPFPLVMTLVCIGQSLHGFCFGCFLAAAFMYVDRVSPKDVRGSMQNLYGTFVLGLGAFVGGFVSGRIGGFLTNTVGTESFRDRMGIATQRGLVAFTDKSSGTEMVRDWLGIWLAGALLAVVAVTGFVLLFPKETPEEN